MIARERKNLLPCKNLDFAASMVSNGQTAHA